MHKMIKNFKIGKKLMMIVVVLVALMVVSAAASIVSFFILNNQVKQFHEGAFMEKEYVMDMNRLFERTQKGAFLAIASNDPDVMDEFLQISKEAAASNSETFEKLAKIYSGDKATLDEYSAITTSIAPIREQVWTYIANQQNEEAAVLASTEWIPLVRQANTIVTAIQAEADSSSNDMLSSIQTTVVTLIILIAAIVIISIVVSVLLSRIVTKSITEPVNDIMKVAEALSHGDFEVDITYESVDELGDTSNALRAMVAKIKSYIQDIQKGMNEIINKNLKVVPEVEYEGVFVDLKDAVVALIMSQDELMKQLQNASNQVSLGAEQLADGAQSLAEGATDQAGAVEELLATVTDVTDQVMDAASATEQASAGARSVGEKSTESSAQMSLMTEAMERISQASKQIEAIIKTIEEIASQTNLLSLNAAIEAARAGEAGKGFAVVAEEIRELANQSAQAALNTRELIETTIAEVDNGDKIANHTAEALKAVSDGISGIIGTIEGVKDAAVQQADQMKQISQAVEQISSVVQNTSATAEESSATSQELSAQATALNNLTEEFTLID